MKRIIKNEPEFYTTFITKERPSNWDDLAVIRQRLRLHMLVEEQNYQCAYTGISIDESNISSHIDHFKKQSMFQELRFIYSNLFTATNNENFGAKYKDKYIKKTDYSSLIDPGTEDPDVYLEYSFDGKIYSKNNSDKGSKTIEIFNLNHPILVNRRKEKIRIFDTLKGQLDLEEILKSTREFEGIIRYLYKNN